MRLMVNRQVKVVLETRYRMYAVLEMTTVLAAFLTVVHTLASPRFGVRCLGSIIKDWRPFQFVNVGLRDSQGAGEESGMSSG